MQKNIFISATIANWFSILNISLYNIISVPIILSKWDVEKFGAWILLNSILTYLYLLNLSLEEFTYSENLKIGKKKITLISKNISNGIFFSLIISFISLIAIFILNKFSNFELINVKNIHLLDFTKSIFAYLLFTTFTYSILPFISDALIIYGYQHFFIWFRSINKFISNLGAIISIYYFNTSIFETVLNIIILESIGYSFIYYFSFKICKKIKLNFKNINFKYALNNFVKSILVFINKILITLTDNGFRIIISNMTSIGLLAIFTVTRTIVNAFMQSINSLSEPIMPHLMRTIAEKEYVKLNNYLNLYFIFISILFFPLLLIINLFIKDIFNYWTLQKILFDDLLYFFLIGGVLIYSLGLPFKLLITGNNLNKEKIIINIISILIMFILLIFFFNKLSLISFGLGIFVFELTTFFLNFLLVKNFFKKKLININFKIFYISLIILIITEILIFHNLIIKEISLFLLIIFYLINLKIFLKYFPKNFKLRIKKIK